MINIIERIKIDKNINIYLKLQKNKMIKIQNIHYKYKTINIIKKHHK